MQADTILSLWDILNDQQFDFASVEIPERITFGGEQKLAVHELVGGVRVVDAMGAQESMLEWSGLFIGENATLRARFLDGWRVKGALLRLTWHEFVYDVVIKSFSADFERFYQLPYKISCVVLENKTNPVTEIASAVDELIYDDAAAANVLSDAIGDDYLSQAINGLNTAIKSVSTFAKASTAQTNGILQQLSAVKKRADILIAQVNNVVQNVATVGGVLPNNPINKVTSKLMSHVNSFAQLPMLYSLNSVLGRMQANIGSTNKTQKQVTVAGGNLFDIAAKNLGDATAWAALARANALTDPVISGVKTLSIPKNDNSGGVLKV